MSAITEKKVQDDRVKRASANTKSLKTAPTKSSKTAPATSTHISGEFTTSDAVLTAVVACQVVDVADTTCYGGGQSSNSRYVETADTGCSDGDDVCCIQ